MIVVVVKHGNGNVVILCYNAELCELEGRWE